MEWREGEEFKGKDWDLEGESYWGWLGRVGKGFGVVRVGGVCDDEGGVSGDKGVIMLRG